MEKWSSLLTRTSNESLVGTYRSSCVRSWAWNDSDWNYWRLRFLLWRQTLLSSFLVLHFRLLLVRRLLLLIIGSLISSDFYREQVKKSIVISSQIFRFSDELTLSRRLNAPNTHAELLAALCSCLTTSLLTRPALTARHRFFYLGLLGERCKAGTSCSSSVVKLLNINRAKTF